MSLWDAIENSIQRGFDKEFSVSFTQPVAGGDISQAYIVSDQRKNYFVKINSLDFLDNFQQEATGLKFLQQCYHFVVPQVIGLGSANQQSYLILDYLKLNSFGDEKRFAESLAALHQITTKQFGFETNNYIGKNPQLNRWSTSWADFFIDYRLQPQFEMLFQKKSITQELQVTKQKLEELLTRCFSILNQHSPLPSLVHGDLWQGNFSYSHLGNPVIFDPACYFADSEVDLAMLELFGSPSSEFYTTYYRLQPRKTGYQIRKKIYNLYHLLNHANLFGTAYTGQVKIAVDEILRLT
jgi:protein-ribulosamine 3-kinase